MSVLGVLYLDRSCFIYGMSGFIVFGVFFHYNKKEHKAGTSSIGMPVNLVPTICARMI